MLLGVVGYFIGINPETACFFSPRILPLKILEVSCGGDDSRCFLPEKTVALLGRKHRDNTLTLKRFSSGVGSGVWVVLPPKTTVKNPWMWLL